MTAQKGLKKLVRERQSKTGERYTTALSQVRAKAARRTVEAPKCHDVTDDAEAAGLHGQTVVSDELWRTTSREWRRLMLGQLHALLESLQHEHDSDLFPVVLRGESREVGAPNAIHEIAESMRFSAQVRAGVRGVSRNGRFVALDVPHGETQVTVFGVFLLWPYVRAGRRPMLWLMTSREREAGLFRGFGAEIASQFSLAGLGGLATED